jgi:hypothetical protein
MDSVQDTLAGGFPHSEIFGSKLVRNSPKLIAAYHVLHRLSAPRHPPNALKTLDHSHCRYPSAALSGAVNGFDRRKDQLLRDLPDRRRFSVTASPCDRPGNPGLGQTFSSRCQKTSAAEAAEKPCVREHEPRQRPCMGPHRQDASGGARRDRTDDLLLAKQALSQLSYGPVRRQVSVVRRLIMVGPGRLELPTSRLSGVRSNHLSYGPQFVDAVLPERRVPSPIA